MLYGADKVTGEQAETASEMRERLRREGNMNTIDDIDYMVSINQASIHENNGNGNDGNYGDRTSDDIHNVNSFSFDSSPFSSDTCSQRSDVSSKKAKINEVEFLRDGLKSVDAIEVSTRKYQLLIKEDEIVDLVLELGIEDSLFGECYLFFVDNLDKLRALFGLPMIRCKFFFDPDGCRCQSLSSTYFFLST